MVSESFFMTVRKGRIKSMELRGSQTQIMKSSNRIRQSKAHINKCAPSLSLVLTTKMWRQHQAMLLNVVPDSTIRMHLDSLLKYRTEGPCTWFIDFHVAELLVQPTQDILVRQPISHPQRGCFARDGSSSTPFGSGRVAQGCTWQGFLSLHLLLWHGGGRQLARPSFPSPSFVAQGGHLAKPSQPSPCAMA